MEILIITSLLGDFSGIAEEIEKEIKENELDEKEEFVSLHQFDMLSKAYDEKFDECEKLKAQIKCLKGNMISIKENVTKICDISIG